MNSHFSTDNIHNTHNSNKNYESDKRVPNIKVNILSSDHTEFILNWERQVTYWYEHSSLE